MHELSLVKDLLELARQEMDRAGHNGTAESLTVIIGKLSGVNADSFRFAFETYGSEMGWTKTRLIIIEHPARCLCQNCHEESAVEEWTLSCPRCGSENIRIEGGREFRLESITIPD